MANTAIDWSGTRWTQILWPLPEDQHQRDTLIAHELFHRIQDRLKLPIVPSGGKAQLDTMDGRYYLQLEWRALSRALEAQTHAERTQAAKDALLFRAERYRLFPQANQHEKELEFNEGLAEYTGVRVGNSSHEEQVKATLNDLGTQTNQPRSYDPLPKRLARPMACCWISMIQAGIPSYVTERALETCFKKH